MVRNITLKLSSTSSHNRNSLFACLSLVFGEIKKIKPSNFFHWLEVLLTQWAAVVHSTRDCLPTVETFPTSALRKRFRDRNVNVASTSLRIAELIFIHLLIKIRLVVAFSTVILLSDIRTTTRWGSTISLDLIQICTS